MLRRDKHQAQPLQARYSETRSETRREHSQESADVLPCARGSGAYMGPVGLGLNVIPALADMSKGPAGLGVNFIPALAKDFKDWTKELADLVELVAAAIIGIAVVEATIRTVWIFFQHDLPAGAKEEMRLRLARWLAVALEFELAADILRTAIAPTWNEVGLLAAIAAIRTGLNFFLEQEIQREAKHTTTATPTRGSYLNQERHERDIDHRSNGAIRHPTPT